MSYPHHGQPSHQADHHISRWSLYQPMRKKWRTSKYKHILVINIAHEYVKQYKLQSTNINIYKSTHTVSYQNNAFTEIVGCSRPENLFATHADSHWLVPDSHLIHRFSGHVIEADQVSHRLSTPPVEPEAILPRTSSLVRTARDHWQLKFSGEQVTNGHQLSALILVAWFPVHWWFLSNRTLRSCECQWFPLQGLIMVPYHDQKNRTHHMGFS